jgi:hypothetical protein
VTHLVKLNQGGKVTASCGALTDVANSTIWWSEVDCPKCRPYVWRDDGEGRGKKMVPVEGHVEPTPPKTKVMRRRSQR